MVPPRIGPAIGAMMVVMVQRPSAMLTCFLGATRISKVCDIGIKGPPQKPCSTRATTSMPRFSDRPQSAENKPKPSAATTSTRTAPKRCASQPVSGTMMASATE